MSEKNKLIFLQVKFSTLTFVSALTLVFSLYSVVTTPGATFENLYRLAPLYTFTCAMEALSVLVLDDVPACGEKMKKACHNYNKFVFIVEVLYIAIRIALNLFGMQLSYGPSVFIAVTFLCEALNPIRGIFALISYIEAYKCLTGTETTAK